MIGIELQPILKNKSGVGWYTYHLINELRKMGCPVSGYAFDFLGRNNYRKQIDELGIFADICTLMPYGVYRRVWRYLPIQYNWLFQPKADIYHFFNFIIPPYIKGKTIVTIYDMVYEKFPETMERKNYLKLKRELKRSAHQSDIIITISENSKKEIIEYLDVEPSKIKIIYPGIDHELFNKDIDEDQKNIIRKKYKLPDRYALYLGNLEPRKNVKSIIKGIAEYNHNYHDNLLLVIAGESGWMYEPIYKTIQEYKMDHNIVFTGYIDEVDKPAIYKMSEIFLFPSLYEGFGIPVLEAMASGVPVITSNTSSLPEVVGDAAILVNPQNVENIVNSIFSLNNNQKLRNDLIQKGLAQSKKYNWKSSATNLYTIYRDFN